MPVYLPPLSRRQFLARTLQLGAALAAPSWLTAARRPMARHSWALLADTHIAGDRTRVVREVNMADNLIAVGQQLAARPERHAGVIVCGDLALTRGEPEDYATLSELLGSFRASPIHLLLGNHDDRENFWAAFPADRPKRPVVAERHAALLRTPRANWFLLDSLDRVNSTPGNLGAAQKHWLARALDANPRRPAIVVAHHNLNRPGFTVGLKDTDELVAILAPRRQVKAFIFGHTHDWGVARHESGLHLINLPPTAYVFRAGLANGWVEMTLEPDGARLELHCLNPAHPQHGTTHQLRWRNA